MTTYPKQFRADAVCWVLTCAAVLLLTGCRFANNTSRGVDYYGQAKYDAAMTAFQEALKAKPNDPEMEYNIAATYHQSGRLSLQSGQHAAAQQQYDQAVQYYRLCLAKKPNHSDAHRGLAALYLDCKSPQEAFQVMTDWVKADPVSSEPKIELARLYQEYSQICQLQGRTDTAADLRSAADVTLQNVLSAEPSNYRALRAAGYLKEQSGDRSAAAAYYQRSLQSNSAQKDLELRIASLGQP
ncbi:MAG: tetratricopeptide repeat protein [Planctomycetaceae bacterium]|jgi:tetratricopeptide (TPR) repeat protein|nr:tetratricopeptide repeat protein [Planctomycetaceae bacterium]